MGNQAQNRQKSAGVDTLLLLSGGVFLLVFLLAAVLFHLLYAKMVTAPPSFFDLIIEDTAVTGYNKAGEITLFRVLTLISLLSVFFLSRFGARFLSRKKDTPAVKDSASAGQPSLILPLLWLSPGLLYCLIDGVLSYPLLFMALFSLFVSFLPAKPFRFALMLLPLLCYYALLSLCIAGSVLLPLLYYGRGGRDPQKAEALLAGLMPSQGILYAAALGLCLLCLLFLFLPFRSGHKAQALAGDAIAAGRLSLVYKILQLPIPLLLCIFFHDLYNDGGALIRLPYAPGYYLLFAGLILFAWLLFARSFFGKHAQKADSLRRTGDRLIALSTPVVLFIYRSYQACPMFAQPDQHHHGEQLIPWQQIAMLGQKPYQSYTPVSGLFPLVNGFIQHVFFGGTVSDYAPAISAVTALVAALTMLLVAAHIKSEKAMLLAVLFTIPSYNRQYLVLPLLLLLFLPALQKRPGLFCILWLFCCFLGGLYYPLFGAAVVAGTLPLLLFAVKALIGKCAAAKKDLPTACKRNLPLLLFAALVLLCIAASLPMLLRMAKHTLTYSSQTILADGISLAGQTPPQTFLASLPLSETTRNAAYLWYRFFLPLVFLWPAALIPGLLLGVREKGTSLRQAAGRDRSLLCKCAAVLLTLLVSYSYTLVRADRGVLLARTAPVLIAVAGIFMAASLLGLDGASAPGPRSETAPESQSSRLSPLFCSVMTGLCLSLPFLCYAHVNDMKNPYLWTYPDGNDALVAEDVSKLFACYALPDGFASMQTLSLSDPSLLGPGYMAADQFHYLSEYDAVKQKVEAAGFSDKSYMGYDGQGFYYYVNTRACATGYLPVARSFAAQEEILDVAKKERPVIFPLDPQKSYYICRWLFSGGADYRYSSIDHCFYPAELYEAVTGQTKGDAYEKDPSDPYAAEPVLFDRICDHFGDSADSLLAESACLQPLSALTKETAATQDSDAKADYLYLPLDPAALQTAAKAKGCDGTLTRLTLSLSGENDAPRPLCVCALGNGRLLIPVGMHPAWLLEKNASPQRLLLTADNGEDESGVSFTMDELLSCLQQEDAQRAGFYRIH